MAIFTILLLPNHEHGFFSHLFVSSLISLSSGQFSLKRSFASFVSCIPRYFILLLWMGVCSWFGSLLVCCLCIGMLVISAHWFLYPQTLLKLLISLRRVWAEAMGSSKYTIMSTANRDNLTSSFPNWIHFISFSCLIAQARTSNTILNRSGERGHPCLVPDFKGNASRFCPSSMILAVGLS